MSKEELIKECEAIRKEGLRELKNMKRETDKFLAQEDEALKQWWNKNKRMPSNEEIINLSNDLNISSVAISNWFNSKMDKGDLKKAIKKKFKVQ
ncbi:hypothetical protein ABK040_006233 [Willaertia magna]